MPQPHVSDDLAKKYQHSQISKGRIGGRRPVVPARWDPSATGL